jgi:inositol-phosphate phosphatase/L-galactose 1-phosphate phosphatase/histidinol-phosphatase
MPDDCPDALIRFAETLADAAGPVLRRHFRTPVAVDSKPDRTPVTIADRDSESAMRSLIARHFPAHGVVGEEHGTERGDAEYVWVLDPIDGTKAFITGKPMFGTLIALVRRGAPILGIIDQPVLGERWVGAAGRPTTFKGAPCRTRACPRPADAVLNATAPDMFTGGNAAAFARLGRTTRLTLYGGDCYAYGLLAAGFIDLVVEADLKPYDFCALVPVVLGAGGAMADWHGRPLTLGSDGRVIAAGDPQLLPRAVEALAAP